MFDNAQTNQRSWEVMSQTGQAFFSSMVEHLATTLGKKVAFIVESMDLKGERVAPRASWGVHGFRGEQAYDTRGTPCERVASGASCIYLKNLSDYFPDDVWLQQSGMQSYVAIPLLDEHAHVLGHMGVLDDQEIEKPGDAIALMESFAHRAREEIVRKRPDTALRRILGESDWLLYRATPPQFSPRLQATDGTGFLGYAQSELVLYDDIRCRQLFEEDRSRVRETFTNAFENGEDFVIHYRLWDRQRETLYHFQDHGRIERDDAGEPIAIVGTLVDITQQLQRIDKPDHSSGFILDPTKQYQTLDKLHESEQHFRALFDNSSCGLLFADPETGEFLECNRRICEMLGYSREELKKRSVPDIHPEEDLPRVMQEFRRMVNNEKARSLNIPVKRKDGSLFYVNISSFWIKHQGKQCLVGAFLDVTENKRTELALREQEARLAYAQKISHVGSWELDLVNGNERWSDEVFRIFGYAPQAFTPSESRKLESVHPDDRAQFQSQLRRGVATREQFEFEFRVQRSNNEVRIVRALNEVVRDRKGKAVSLLGTLQDVTQRRQAEAQLRRSHEELRRLTDHLQSARESERISIAREIHDEMAQSLTAQKIDMVRLKSRLPQDEPFLTELSGEILQSINQTINSVQRILTELRPALLDDLGLVAAIEWQVTEFQRRTERKCHLVLPDDEPDLTLKQRTAMFRIMQESLSNVLRHSNADEVWVELTVDKHWLLMSIVDNGKGISEVEVLDSRSFGLMGMRERAHIFGGTASIYGKEGKGTTVFVTIPLNSKRGKVN